MTDKTPKNQAENSVNTPTTLAGTTDTARDRGPKSRALPQADALKARFKAGSIPLQTDFADLIDLANIGRQAVGDESTGLGLAKDGKNRLRFDPSKIANFTYDLSPSKGNEQIMLPNLLAGDTKVHAKVALLALSKNIGPRTATTTKDGNSTTYTVNAVKINADGVRNYSTVRIIADKSVGKSSALLPFEYVQNKNSLYSIWYKFTLDTTDEDFSNCTLVIDPLTLLVKHITDFSTLPLDGEIISLLTVSFVYHGFIIGDGLQKDNAKISVKVDGSKGLQVNSSGVGVKVGKGMRVSSTGMIEPNVDSYGFGIVEEGIEYAPIKVNTSTNSLVVDLHKGLINTPSGLSVNVGNGLKADRDNGVSLIPEQTFQKGMVMMFSGTSIPPGWALCDGNNGTPNLINRFIMGGGSTDVGGRSNNTFSGGNNSKTISFNTKQSSVNISGRTDGHSLNAEENGPHSHYAGIAVGHSSKCLSGHYRYLGYSVDWLNAGTAGRDPRKYEPQVYSDGSGKAHSHAINFTGGNHSHNSELTVPYYILAFIIKL